MEKLLGSLLALLAIAGITVPLFVLNGFVLSNLWAWFVVPLGAPPIGIAEGIGLAIVVAAMRDSTPRPQKEEDFTTMAIRVFVGPFITLGIGYVVHVVAG